MTTNRIEDAFHAFLVCDTLKNALAFAEFARANGMTYDGAYEMHYKGKLVCYIDTPNDASRRWRVWTVGDYRSEYEDFPIDATTKEIAWAHVLKCGNCDDVDCDPGKTEVVFGKEFEHVCHGAAGLAMRFADPDADALACAIKMIEMAMFVIDHPAE